MNQTPEQLAALLPILGIKLTPEQLEERVVTQIVECILNEPTDRVDLDEGDEDGNLRVSFKERMHQKTLEAVRERIDAAIGRYFDEKLTSNFDSLVRGIIFPRTNGYGEKKAEPETLLEHFERMAREYMAQKVDYNGREESYSDRNSTPRLVWWMNQHFRADMERGIQNALKDIGNTLAEQLKQTVAKSIAAVRVSA